jgi:hypothetical protein
MLIVPEAEFVFKGAALAKRAFVFKVLEGTVISLGKSVPWGS